MARASHKIDLLQDSHEKYQILKDCIAGLTKEEQDGKFPFEDRDKNIRDVLIHLHEWHNMLLDWYNVGCIQNKKPDVPKKGYTWGTLKQMNEEIWEMYQTTSLEEAKQLLDNTHQQVIKLIEGLSNEQLYLRNQYAWTGDSVLRFVFRREYCKPL